MSVHLFHGTALLHLFLEYLYKRIPSYLSRDLVNVNCQQMVKKSYSACEHSRMVKCSEDVSSEKCRENCGTYLTCCGRNCQSSCSDCQDLSPRNAENSLIQRTSHGRHPCRKVLFCGHPCQEGCSENHECTKKCMKQCQRSCRHSVCAKACHIVCAPCAEPCSWECPHAGRCPLPCGSICLRLPCDERCTKVLPCGHLCLSCTSLLIFVSVFNSLFSVRRTVRHLRHLCIRGSEE